MLLRKKGLLLMAPALLLALSFQLGCATKKYVKQQTDPVSGRVDELSEVSKRNETAIKDRRQSGPGRIQTVNKDQRADQSHRRRKGKKAQQMARRIRHRLSVWKTISTEAEQSGQLQVGGHFEYQFQIQQLN
jgi:hypothetical protein